MKLLLQSVGMAVVLFFYGFLLSTAGYDHSAHQHNTDQARAGQEEHHGSAEAGHAHSHQ